ncbi:MAG: sigma 54-interacting transcriptional regulator [Pyrinomonadaceae bacterium]
MSLPDFLMAIIDGDGRGLHRRALPPFNRRPPRRGPRCLRGTVFLLLLIVVPFLLTPDASAQPATKRVLILTGADPNHPGFSTITQSVRSIIRDGSKDRVELLYELQEGFIREPGSPREDSELVSYLERKYGGKNIDLILSAAAPRLRLLLKSNPGLFAGVPKVFYDFEEQREPTYRDVGNDITGVWARIDYRQTLDLAFAIQPDARRVVVVAGNSAEERAVLERARSEFHSYEGRAEFTYLTDLTLAELKDRLAALPRDSIVFYLIFYADKAGSKYPGPEALSIIAPTSGAPIYGNSDSYMGAGIVGGSLIDFKAIGQRLGDVCLRVLAGQRLADITSYTAPNVITFDWRELRRWGLSEEGLPPGSVVKFRQFSFWELYKWYIVGGVAACVIEGLLIAYLLIAQRRRRRAERERERFASLAEAEHRQLNEVVSNVPGIVWASLIDPDTDTRRATFISDYVEKMLGYTSEEWLSSPPGFGYRLMPEEDRERAKRDSEEVVRTGKDAITLFRWRAKDGRLVWVESHQSAVLDEAGKVVGLRGVSIDVTEKELAEDAGRQSEERNRATLRAIPDLMFLQTRDGVYLDYYTRDPNDLYVPPEKFIGRSVREVVPPELAEVLLDRFKLVDESSDPQVIEYALPIGGQERWYEARIVGCGENVLSVVREVTERKQAEIALRNAVATAEQNRAQIESIFEAVADGIMVSDMAGNVLLANESMARMNGYESADEMRRTLTDFAENYELFHPDGRPVPYEEWPLSRVLRGESVTDLELRVRRTDIGRERFISYSGEPVRDGRGEQVLAIIVTSDITERKAAEEALRESEARFREMADTAPIMIWVSDVDKRRTYFNKQWLDFAGRSIEKELGDGWAERVYSEDYKRCLGTYVSAFERREPFTMEYRLRRHDGEYRWVYAVGAPRFTSAGEFHGYIGSSVDITERKESESALREAMEELRMNVEEVERLKNQLEEENVYLQEEIRLEHNFSEIVGHSDAIKYVLHKIEQVAPTESTVLITGETGTGKELVARAIHGESALRDRPLVKVNCAALSASLIESELFGHEKGAFTGAVGRKIGRFELADGATMFLDEIGELPLELQVKLLRVIQEGEFERLGSTRTIKVVVRIIAATNRNLREEIQQGRFREDLFYRLNVFPITVPPLRQRVEDISVLVEHYVNRFSKRMGKRITSIAPAMLSALRNYSWPGNVRELANVIERAVINSSGPVLHIPNVSEALHAENPAAANKTLEEVERDYITSVLDSTSWRIEGRHGAARILGLHPSTLRTRMAKLRIQKPQQSYLVTLTKRVSG